ncbi:hypothetical protein [Breoghania sp. L-A4]|uniref:hypothetical protein n=1 Tax=Breoghania sp. L-A4 TaxID=2304600 RepID=UPI0013C311AB|nr:hypothetical protein [Breoghania sp. L-A4]
MTFSLPRATTRPSGLALTGAFMGLGSRGYFQAIERLPVALAALMAIVVAAKA